MKSKVTPICCSNGSVEKPKWHEMESISVQSQFTAEEFFFFFFSTDDEMNVCRVTESSNARTLDTTSLFHPHLNENCSYFVFVTFVEIYNNYIYDLFDDDLLNK